MVKTEAINCPNCGAPLALDPARTAQAQGKLMLCIYCNSSIRLGPGGEGAVAGAHTASDVLPEVGEKVKQLIVDGKRAEAIAYYAEQAAVTPAEAEKMVNQLSIPLALRLTRQSPVDMWAILLSLAIIAGLAYLAAWTLVQALQGGWVYALGTLVCVWMLVARIRWLAPKAVSTWVHSFGAPGRARILHLAAISPSVRQGGTLVVAMLEVQPEGGGAVFRDEETWLIRNESLHKVQPGNVIPVRYEVGRGDRVFPISPIKVWDEQRGEFV